MIGTLAHEMIFCKLLHNLIVSGYAEVNLSTVNMDGSEMWVTLGQMGNSKETVSGDVCLTFAQGTVSLSSAPRNANVIVDDIKKRMRAAQEGGGTELDMSGCELAKAAIQNFPNTERLDLSFNKFSQFPEVFAFGHLQVLDLNGNQITDIPNNITSLTRLLELHMNGNLLSSVPDTLCSLTTLEKLSLGNNRITSVSFQIGKLRKLEELTLTGNPISDLPPSMGCLQDLEILDLSCCNLTELNGEFTYMTKLLELNLATNEITSLPDSMGRMSRLVVLNVADNKLKDLPLSLGMCIGLAKFGAGVNIERNQITDQEMLRKYKIGPDHMLDFLEKRMIVNGVPELESFELPFGANTPVKAVKSEKIPQWGAKRAESKGVMFTKGAVAAPPPEKQMSSPPLSPQTPKATPSATPPPAATGGGASPALEEKIVMLKKWAHTTIQQELRSTLDKIQQKTDAASDPQEVVKLAQIIKQLKPAVDKARQEIDPFETPKPNPEGPSKVDLLKGVISAALEELALTLRGIQIVLESTESSRVVVAMVGHVKGMKATLDANPI